MLKLKQIFSRPKNTFILGILLLIVANIGFSTKAILVKLLYRYGISTADVLSLRMFFSLPFFVITAYYLHRRTENVRITPLQWLIISLLGILSYYVSSMLDFLGLQYVSAAVERLVLFTYPTLILILSAVFFNKKITPPQYIALIITYLGVVLAFVAEKGIGTQNNLLLGASLVFACAFTYAVYIVLMGEYVHRIGSMKFTCYAMIAATFPAIAQGYWQTGLNIFNFPMPVYGLTAWLVLAATVVPVFMISEGVRRVGAANAGIIGFSGPVATIFLAWFFLNEPISPMQIVGTIVVLIGVFIISRQKDAG